MNSKESKSDFSLVFIILFVSLVVVSILGYNFYRQNQSLLVIISEYEDILDEKINLERYYNETLEKYYELREEYNVLDERYEKLYNDYHELIDKEYKYVLDGNKIINIGPEMNVTLNYPVMNNDLLALNYSSTGDIFFWIGSTSLNQSYYSRYPAFPKTSRNGSMMVPITPDLLIFIQNTESYNVTVTFSAMVKRAP